MTSIVRFVFAAGWLVLPAVAASAAEGVEPPTEARSESWVGWTLADALRALQARGLPLLFTSNRVTPEMIVREEPAGDTDRARLDALLAAHGLRVIDGAEGRLVVVPGPPAPAQISGTVWERGRQVPLADVQVEIAGTGRNTTTDGRGRFTLASVPPGSVVLEVRRPGFVVAHLDAIPVPVGGTAQLEIELDPAPVALDEIVVTPSRVSLLQDEPVAGLDLDRDDILALPHLGDDIFRALTLLPGVTGQEVSATFNVRGGRDDEVLVLLDRIELFEPYHLKDYSSSVSIVTPRALREVNLLTGGFPAQYGDRMSGVLDMQTVAPSARRFHLGLGIIQAEIGGAGTLGSGRGRWLTSVRRGSLDLTLDFLGQNEQPRFRDAFGKVSYAIAPGQHLGLHLLAADDRLDFFNIDPDTTEDYQTSYGNDYLWLTHQAIPHRRLLIDTLVSRGWVARDRRGREVDSDQGDEGTMFSLVDRRRLTALVLKQDWLWQAGDRHQLRAGFEARRLTTDYDYRNDRVLDDPLADARAEPRTGTTVFRDRLRGDHLGVYLSERSRLGAKATLELGLRYDEQSITAERHVSPRFNLAYALGADTVVRAAWGFFYQSQRPYELQVEDGLTQLASAERTEQRVVGIERRIARGARRPPLMLRLEAYQRVIVNPRARYENILEPVSIFPEIEADRIRFAPERSRAYGIELLVRGRFGSRVDWWASYTHARIRDRIDGADRPRGIDQPHAVTIDVNLRAGAHWNLNAAWRYHTGWPTTALSGRLVIDEDGEEEVVPVLGPIHGERLAPYHRLDIRLRREWQKKRGTLGFFLEIQNLYHRENQAGVDVDIETAERPDETIRLVVPEKVWGGILPSFGITWDF